MAKHSKGGRHVVDDFGVKSGYEGLAEAIIKREIADYKNAYRRGKGTQELERFFKSDYFEMLATLSSIEVSGDYLMKLIRGNVDAETA